MIGRLRAAGADALDHLLPIDVRQAKVEHDQIGAATPRHVEGGVAEFGLRNRVALRRQPRAQEAADGWLVIDDQHP